MVPTAFAAKVAIIDSGVDLKHQDIVNSVWVNKLEIPNNNRDEDRNGYQDDVNGWNFFAANNEVIDYKYLGLLTDDVRKFFKIQAKALAGTMTPEELEWAREMIKNEQFLKDIQAYGNFSHGTHVAGIALKGSSSSEVMAVKIIPTEVQLPGAKDTGRGLGMTLLKQALGFLAAQQMNLMQEVALYVNDHEMNVANGSFGTGYVQASMIVKGIFNAILKRDPTEEENKEAALHFLNAVIKEGQRMVDSAPNTLFVFAAGNDGTNNDEFPSSPANLRADNVITVAATFGTGKIAPFSNFGITTVDIAAAGVSINSTVPGNNYLAVSGTSQAAPLVANAAAQVYDSNSSLLPGQIKEILMNTVDLKESLNGKVISGGIVNITRATYAAALSANKGVSLAQAIAKANERYAQPADHSMEQIRTQVPFMHGVLPLQSLFKYSVK
jgi:subtilisin family serine protease